MEISGSPITVMKRTAFGWLRPAAWEQRPGGGSRFGHWRKPPDGRVIGVARVLFVDTDRNLLRQVQRLRGLLRAIGRW